MAGAMMKAMVVVAALIMVMEGVTATIFTVGDKNGWRVPPSTDFYSDWAAKQTFAVGDVLEFNFAPGSHTVAIVTSKDAYEQCNAILDPNVQIIMYGPVKVPLNRTGEYYFFCTIGPHCDAGQKFAIDIPASADVPETADAPGTEPTAPSVGSPAGAPGPSPDQSQPQGGSSSGVAPLSASILSVFFVALVAALLH